MTFIFSPPASQLRIARDNVTTFVLRTLHPPAVPLDQVVWQILVDENDLELAFREIRRVVGHEVRRVGTVMISVTTQRSIT